VRRSVDGLKREKKMAYNVLIVDDSAIVRSVIKRAILLSGVDAGEIYEAANGKEAIERLDSAWVDIVFSDINMPIMDGIEMVKSLDQKGILKETPVVIVSTDRSEVRIRQMKACGVREYLNKPFTPEEIRDVINKCLGKVNM
jgi:two-component system, chemotaxis family, chemotaxis protein CheY